MSVNLPRAIQSCHMNGQFYVLNDEMKIHKTSFRDCQNPLITARQLLELAQDPAKAPEDRKILESCAWNYIEKIEKHQIFSNNSENENELKLLKSKSFILLLNIEPTPENVDLVAKNWEGEWVKMIIKFNIHYYAHRQSLPFKNPHSGEFFNQICRNGEWSSLEDSFLSQNSQIHFFWDASQGLVHYSEKNQHLENFFNRSATGKYYVNACLSGKDTPESAYLSLENSNGTVSFFKDHTNSFRSNPLTCFIGFGRNPGVIRSPSIMSSIPLWKLSAQELKIEITKEQFDTLWSSIKEDLDLGTEKGIIRANCVAFVEQKLKLIGIKVKTTSTFQEFLFRNVCFFIPKPLIDRVISWKNHSLPEWFKKAFLFFPLIYVPTIVVAVPVSLFSGMKGDISLLNAIFRPWKLKINSPLSMQDEFERLQEENQTHHILTAHSSSESEIGKKIQEMNGTLGYTLASQGRIKALNSTIDSDGDLPWWSQVVRFFDAMVERVENFIHQSQKNVDQDFFSSLHLLKNRGMITPYQYIELYELRYDGKLFNNKLQMLFNQLQTEGKIDRWAHIHLKSLVLENNRNDAVTYLLALSFFSYLMGPDQRDSLSEIMTPEVEMAIDRLQNHYKRKLKLDQKDLNTILKLAEKHFCYSWTSQIVSSNPSLVGQMQASIKENRPSDFKGHLIAHYKELSQSIAYSQIQTKMIQETIETIQSLDDDKVFIGFANVLHTQQGMKQIIDEILELASFLETHKETIDSTTAEELKRLHQNMGVSLQADAVYSGSSTFFKTLVEYFKSDWEKMNTTLQSLGHADIISDEQTIAFWPTLEGRSLISIDEERSAAEITQSTATSRKVKSTILHHLNSNYMLSRKNVHNTIYISLTASIGQAPFIEFNKETSQFEQSTQLKPKDLAYALQVLKSQALYCTDPISENTMKQLQAMLLSYQDKDPKKAGKLWGKFAHIDRYRVALSVIDPLPTTLQEAQDLYLMEETKQELQQWINCRTADGQELLSEKDAIAIFLKRPLQYDFIKNLNLHKRAAFFNNKFEVDASGHLCVLFAGKMVSVNQLLGSYHLLNHRLIRAATGEKVLEHAYFYVNGLCTPVAGFTPIDSAPGSLAHYKNNPNRKHNDYRIEVITSLGEENHSWLRIKTLSGDSCSLGRAENPDYKRSMPFETNYGIEWSRGYPEEYFGDKKNWKKTKIIINEVQFDRLLNKIEKERKENHRFNVINNNGTTFVSQMLQEVGITYRTYESYLSLICLPRCIRKFLTRHAAANAVVHLVTFPFDLVRNIIVSFGGMWSSKENVRGSQGGFNNWWDLFNVTKSMIDHPDQLRLVQEILEGDQMSSDGKIYLNQVATAAASDAVARESIVC